MESNNLFNAEVMFFNSFTYINSFLPPKHFKCPVYGITVTDVHFKTLASLTD